MYSGYSQGVTVRLCRIQLHLWNECESPTVLNGLDEDEWSNVKDVYARATQSAPYLSSFPVLLRE